MVIIFLGGMSESGKSYTGQHMEANYNFKRIKIIEIEKELIEKYNINPNNEFSFSECLIRLYEHPNVYVDFLDKIKSIAKQKHAVLESLYRRELFLGILDLNEKTYCLFVEADKEKRIQREYSKEINKHRDFNEFLEEFEKKEEFKIKHKADKIYVSANFILWNNSTIKELDRQIYEIMKRLSLAN